jgi:hypothetical protein
LYLYIDKIYIFGSLRRLFIWLVWGGACFENDILVKEEKEDRPFFPRGIMTSPLSKRTRGLTRRREYTGARSLARVVGGNRR